MKTTVLQGTGRKYERGAPARQRSDELAASKPRRADARSPLVLVARPVLLTLVATALLAGVLGGLLRAGMVLPVIAAPEWLPRAALFHAPLMIGGMMGTVIGVERAVALKLGWAFVAPFASGVAALALLFGLRSFGAWLMVAAAGAFCAVNAVVVRRQPADHSGLLLLGALAWLAGSISFAAGGGATLAFWFAFLVLTIGAERLEMTRLLPRRPSAQRTLHAILAGLLLGAAVSTVSPASGGLLFGGALVALASWLALHDIARRTVFAHGLSRYMAICLLGGYGWLGVAGIAWAATALGLDAHDAALHALGLGFVFSMVLGHAPVIVPAVSRLKVQFGGFFYVPLAVLHLSLIVRLGFGLHDPVVRSLGAALNAAALALFVATVLGSAVVRCARPLPG